MLTPLKTSLVCIITLLQSTSKIVRNDEMQTVVDGKTNLFFFSEIQLSRHSYLEPMDREGQGNSGIFTSSQVLLTFTNTFKKFNLS